MHCINAARSCSHGLAKSLQAEGRACLISSLAIVHRTILWMVGVMARVAIATSGRATASVLTIRPAVAWGLQLNNDCSRAGKQGQTAQSGRLVRVKGFHSCVRTSMDPRAGLTHTQVTRPSVEVRETRCDICLCKVRVFQNLRGPSSAHQQEVAFVLPPLRMILKDFWPTLPRAQCSELVARQISLSPVLSIETRPSS